MKTEYQIELADNGMIVRRPGVGEVKVFEYVDNEYGRSEEAIAKWIGEDILDDMLESPEIKDEIKNEMQRTGADGINDFEISVIIKPIAKMM